MNRAPHKNLISVSDQVTSETYEILLSSRGEFLSKSYLFGTMFVAETPPRRRIRKAPQWSARKD
jgi:hypothetical protein